MAIGFTAARTRSTRGQDFSGQVALITGGSRGLGLALALRLAAEGARLVLLARDRQELDAAAERLFATGAQHVQVIVCDVRDPDDVNAAVERVIATEGRVDLIVNNAGVIQTTPFEHAQIEDYEDSLRTHFWGPLFVTRAAVPHMRRQGGGRIVNIASIGGRIGVPHMAPYCAGKFALVGFSESIRAELAKDNIRVTTATPGLLRTGSHRNVVVRGNHVREAQWFALGSSSSLTSMDADRAARQILDAARRGRSQVSPGWQSGAVRVVNALAPGLAAAVAGFAATWILPGPVASGEANQGRWSRDLDTGPVSKLFPSSAAVRFNQPVAADEKPSVGN